MINSTNFKKILAIVVACIVLFIPTGQSMTHSSIAHSPSDITPSVSDFSISASPSSMTLPVGSTSVSTITLASMGGFTGKILLEASSYPLDVSLDKTNVTLASGGTASTTLTISAPVSAPPGNYTVTVGGTSGCSLTHSAYLTVAVTGPDFTITAVKTLLTAPPGGSDSTTLDLASKNGFSGSVTLFSPSSAGSALSSPPTVSLTSGGTGSSLLTLSVSPSTLPGNYTLEVIASSLPLSHFLSIDVKVTGPGFLVSSSLSLTVMAGGASNSTTITVTPFGGFAGIVSLTNSSSASGLITALSPKTLTLPGTFTSTLTVTAPAGTMPESFIDVTVTGNSTGFTAFTDVFVTVKGPDFGISASPTFLSVAAGGPACTSTITVASLLGFSGVVTLTNSTSGPGPTLSLSVSSLPGSGMSTLTVLAPSGTAPATYFVDVKGTSGPLMHDAEVFVVVTGPDFSLSASPSSLSITAPASGTSTATSTVTIKYLNGFAGMVTLGATAYGFNMSATISPSTISSPGTATLSVGVGPSAISGVYTAVVTGTSGSLSHSVYVSVTVIAPDFTISASLNPITINTIGPSTAIVSITGINGFTSTVSLSVSPPFNLNASITPASISGTGTATLSLNSTVPGSYVVEVDGYTASLFHYTFVTVTVVGPDFSLSASPSSPTITAGSNANSTITATALNGFSGTINLTATSSTGLTPTLNASSVTPSQAAKLTIQVAAGTVPGTYSVDVTGKSGSLTHTVLVTVNVSGFTLTASPISLTLSEGSSGVSVVTVASVNGFTGAVSLASSSPAGLTAGLNSTGVTSSGHVKLTVAASVSIAPGSYLVNVTGTAGALTQTATVTIIIPTPDFSITAMSPITVTVGVTGNSTVTIGSIGGFTGTVALTSKESPAGLSCSLSSASVLGGSGTSTLSCNGSTGTYAVIVNGTSTSAGSHTTTVTFTVTDFTISAGAVSPSQKYPGLSGTSTITLTAANGLTGTVNLSVSSSTPAGLTCTLPGTATFGTSPQTRTLSCSAASSGDYTVTVTGAIGSLSHTTGSIMFHVTDFTVTPSPASVTVLASAAANSTITIAPLNSFGGTITLSSMVSPTGLSCTFTPTSLVLGASKTSTLSCTGSGGVYTVTVTGTGGGLSHSATVTVTIQDFSITASPTSLSVAVSTTGSSTMMVTFKNGFTGTVGLSSSASPSTGVTCSLSPVSRTGSGTSTLSCVPSASGTFTVTVTGTSGSISHSLTVTVTASTPDFTLSASQTSLTIQTGSLGISTLTVTPTYGFTGTVSISATVSPSGPTVTVETSTVTGGSGTSRLTLTVDSSVAPATYTITVQGVSGQLSHSQQISLTVTAPSGASNILGLPATTFYALIAGVVLSVAAGGLYFLKIRGRARKKP